MASALNATATTTQANELVFGALYVQNTSETISAGSGFSMRAQYSDSNDNAVVGVEDKVVSSTGTQTCTDLGQLTRPRLRRPFA